LKFIAVQQIQIQDTVAIDRSKPSDFNRTTERSQIHSTIGTVVKYTGSKYFYPTVRIESSSVKKRSSLAPKNYNKKTKKKIWRSKGRAVLMTSGLETGQQAPDASMQ
jgi:hypothetical protein